MTPLVPIVPLVLAGLVAWRLVTRAYEPVKPASRTVRRSSPARAGVRNGRSPRSRKKRNGG